MQGGWCLCQIGWLDAAIRQGALVRQRAWMGGCVSQLGWLGAVVRHRWLLQLERVGGCCSQT